MIIMPSCYCCKKPCNHGDLWGSLVPIMNVSDAVGTDWEEVKQNIDPSRHKKRYWYLCESCSSQYRNWLEDVKTGDGEKLDLSIQGWIVYKEAQDGDE